MRRQPTNLFVGKLRSILFLVVLTTSKFLICCNYIHIMLVFTQSSYVVEKILNIITDYSRIGFAVEFYK